MSTVLNQTFADVTLCGETVFAESQVVTTDVINLTVEKEASCQYVLVGGRLCYTVTITNDSDVDFTTGELGGVIFRDPLAENLTYIPGTFEYTIDCGQPDPVPPVQVEPTINSDNVMTYDSLQIPAGCKAIVTFCVTVGAQNGDDN